MLLLDADRNVYMSQAASMKQYMNSDHTDESFSIGPITQDTSLDNLKVD